ncbi:transposase, partial [Streptomyces sp. NPDC055085]
MTANHYRGVRHSDPRCPRKGGRRTSKPLSSSTRRSRTRCALYLPGYAPRGTRDRAGRGVRGPVSEGRSSGPVTRAVGAGVGAAVRGKPSDRAAANAVRTRIDWKYALGLDLDDPGFDYSVLCEFRARLAEDDAADRLLRVMLRRLVEAGLLKAGGRQRTDATHVLASVRTLSRLELVGETLRAALEQLAQAAPDWLLPVIEPEWDKRYGRKAEIGRVPGGKTGVTALAEAFRRDGQMILTAAWSADAPPRLKALTQVEILRQVWVHHYVWDARGQLRWRDGHALPPASLRFDSPYDTDAHYCVKRDTAWSGYRTHLTETCTSDLPEVVVHVATTIAPVQDGELTPVIHEDLATINLTPAEHAVDAAYISPTQIERARRVHGITLLRPVVPDHSHQAKSGAGSLFHVYGLWVRRLQNVDCDVTDGASRWLASR